MTQILQRAQIIQIDIRAPSADIGRYAGRDASPWCIKVKLTGKGHNWRRVYARGEALYIMHNGQECHLDTMSSEALRNKMAI